MARSERGLKEGGENLGRKVRKRAPQATRRWFEVGEKANVGTGSGGEEGRRTKGGGPAADGGGRESFLEEKHVLVYFPERGEFFVFLN